MIKICTSVALSLLLFSFQVSAQTTLSKKERKAAISHLKATQMALLKEVKGLTEEQLNYKATPESWSIAECVEHLAIAESKIFALVAKSLEGEADPSKRSELKFDDEGIIQMITDRSSKAKAPEPFQPSDKFGSYEGSLESFKSLRKSNMEYTKTTEDDLRSHFFEFRFGLVDSYQIILFMSGHTTRHTMQIKEVKISEGYPAS